MALEQAQLFVRLGSKVTLPAHSRVASADVPEGSDTPAGVFADEDIVVVQRATVSSVRTDQATGSVSAAATVAGRDQEFTGSRLLVATGRHPVTEGLNLSAVGVKTGARGEILVNPQLNSTNKRIWGARDVSGHREFVYVAASPGTLAVENAFNHADRDVDYRHLPRVTFTSPALAAVGMVAHSLGW